MHEKTILLPYLAYLICYKELKLISGSFCLISTFSLYPLLARENQLLPYSVLIAFYFILTKYSNKIYSELANEAVAADEEILMNKYLKLAFKILESLNITAITLYHVCELIIPPPKTYPWLYPTLNAFISFGNLVIFYFYANLRILQIIRNNNKQIKTLKVKNE